MDRVPLLDDDTVMRLRALADDVAEPGEDVLGDLLRTFAEDLELRLATLTAQLARDDTAGAAETAHALKGASLTMGAPRLAEALRRLELALRGGESHADAAAACHALGPVTLDALRAALVPAR